MNLTCSYDLICVTFNFGFCDFWDSLYFMRGGKDIRPNCWGRGGGASVAFGIACTSCGAGKTLDRAAGEEWGARVRFRIV
jgi:hypothetical protein